MNEHVRGKLNYVIVTTSVACLYCKFLLCIGWHIEWYNISVLTCSSISTYQALVYIKVKFTVWARDEYRDNLYVPICFRELHEFVWMYCTCKSCISLRSLVLSADRHWLSGLDADSLLSKHETKFDLCFSYLEVQTELFFHLHSLNGEYILHDLKV